jgi:hypothetical protein
MQGPSASRPYMPGYGIARADEGRGLLPWEWAQERLARSREYWVATTGLGGGTQLSPVWGVWDGASFWFSSSGGSRKARNLGDNPRCTVATADTRQPVVLEGRGVLVSDPASVASFAAASDEKYATTYGVEFYLANACFRVDPERVFGLDDADFTGTPTRWVFPYPPG